MRSSVPEQALSVGLPGGIRLPAPGLPSLGLETRGAHLHTLAQTETGREGETELKSAAEDLKERRTREEESEG